MPPLPRGPLPYYHQIGAIFRDKITKGEMRKGDKLPSEQELCRIYGVCRATVRQALQGLEHDGLIERHRGKGSFIAGTDGRVVSVKMTCLLEDLIALGIPASNVLVRAEVGVAPREVAETMRVEPNAQLFLVERIVMVEVVPFALQRIYLPASCRSRLADHHLAAPHLLRTLEEQCKVRVETAEHLVEAVLADLGESRRLNIDPGDPLLLVSRTSYDRRNAPVGRSVTLYRSDRVRFHMLQRKRHTRCKNWVMTSQGPKGRSAAIKSDSSPINLVVPAKGRSPD